MMRRIVTYGLLVLGVIATASAVLAWADLVRLQQDHQLAAPDLLRIVTAYIASPVGVGTVVGPVMIAAGAWLMTTQPRYLQRRRQQRMRPVGQ